MNGRVVVCGNMSLDTIVSSVEQIAWGTTAAVDRIEQHLGGNGASCAYTLGKLKVPVTLMSLAGKDATAEQLLAQLRNAGVECQVEQGELPTSVSVSLVDAEGRRALLYQLGASAGEFRKPATFPADTRHFHLSALYRMRDLRLHGAQMLQEARQAGLSTSVDAQWDHLNEWPPLPPCDLLFLNEDEANHLTGFADSAEVVVLKLGARGCVVYAEGEQYRVPGMPVEAVDTTGAGDCFCGAYLAALHRGERHQDAANFANRVSAFTVTKLGATAALDDPQFSSL